MEEIQSDIQLSDFEKMEQSFILLNDIFRKRDDFIRNKYRISSLEMELIQYVMRNGPQKMKAVAEFFHIKLSTLTSIIDKAEKQRILKRVNSKNDRRVVFLDITKKGKKVFEEYKKYLHDMILRMQDSFDKDAFEKFVSGIETFNQISIN